MKCPNCDGSNLTADQHPSSAGSKYSGSQLRHSLAKSGHPILTTIVGTIQAGVAIHETFNITYTCHDCNHTFNKFESWKL